MKLSKNQLRAIYAKTHGYCYYDGKKLAFTNYGKFGEKGAWEADHSVAKSKGGSNYMRNLVPACTDCNKDKSNDTRGSAYKRKFELATLGGQINEFLGLDPGTLGASRRKVRLR